MKKLADNTCPTCKTTYREDNAGSAFIATAGLKMQDYTSLCMVKMFTHVLKYAYNQLVLGASLPDNRDDLYYLLTFHSWIHPTTPTSSNAQRGLLHQQLQQHII